MCVIHAYKSKIKVSNRKQLRLWMGKNGKKREKKDNKRPCVPTAIVRTKSLAKIWGMVKNSVNFKREISLTGNAEEVSTSKMYNKNVEIKIARSQNNHYSVNVMNEIKTKSNVNNNAKRKRGEKSKSVTKYFIMRLCLFRKLCNIAFFCYGNSKYTKLSLCKLYGW